MARGIDNYGVQMVVNRSFLPLVIETGIVNQIKIILSESQYAITKVGLIEQLAAWLDGQGETKLADSLNAGTLDAIIKYMGDNGQSPVSVAEALPSLLNENGPAETTASISGNTISGTYTTHPQEGSGVTAELYLDNTYVKDISGGAFTQNTGGIAIETVRVLYRRDSDGAISKFGPVVTL